MRKDKELKTEGMSVLVDIKCWTTDLRLIINLSVLQQVLALSLEINPPNKDKGTVLRRPALQMPKPLPALKPFKCSLCVSNSSTNKDVCKIGLQGRVVGNA